MKLLVAASLAALAFGAILPVDAQGLQEIVVTGTKASSPGTAVRSKTVTYADLDLSNQAGVKALFVRIRGAAHDVCSPQPGSSDVAASADYQKCVSHAMDAAIAQVNNPDLTAMVASAAH